MSSDRTPADVIDEAVVGYGDGNTYLDGDMAIAALAAAGFRVTPEPDDTTRALAERLRTRARLSDLCHGGVASVETDDLRAAAAYLDGLPGQRPDRCPTCDSDNPRWPGRHSGYLTRPCPDQWHHTGRARDLA